MKIILSSSEFKENGTIPSVFTCTGDDISPPLSWENVPAGTKSLALIMDDPDAPLKTWVHWVLFDLPAGMTSLPAGIEKTPTIKTGGYQGLNDFRKTGYGGPCPPPGKPHHYFFKIYALDTILKLAPGRVTKADVEKAMQGHILAQGELVGLFNR